MLRGFGGADGLGPGPGGAVDAGGGDGAGEAGAPLFASVGVSVMLSLRYIESQPSSLLAFLLAVASDSVGRRATPGSVTLPEAAHAALSPLEIFCRLEAVLASSTMSSTTRSPSHGRIGSHLFRRARKYA